MHQLLAPRNIPLLTKEKYQEVFTFPVQDYYQEIGIDFEKDPFDIIGHQFMDLYFAALPTCQLHENVEKVLSNFQRQNKRQFILSAMEHESLLQSLKDYGIDQYFEAVYGIDNHLAAGKTQRAQQMMTENQINPKQSIMFGDTLHDQQVAQEMGIDIILIANGHQNKERLQFHGNLVLDDLSKLLLMELDK